MRRMTAQKKFLYEQVKNFKSFFDAYEFHLEVNKTNKKIGLATIYRFLNTLEKDMKIHSFLCNNKKIYSNHTKNHVHFTCESCNKLKHIKIKNADFLSELVDDEVCHFQIELIGVCSSCKQKL
ncbi:transcriptional repressor [Candidatus Woesearchaeota archaeon]|nr:transcriptional repressor [Candidatus Woesearchaeota archaeon]